jgi:predicted TIM-barrel fold metal-dependent hydrolase
MIKNKEIKKYLQIINDLKQHVTFYDMHAHPFEVISNDIDYCQCENEPRTYSKNGSRFIPPEIMDGVCIYEKKNANLPDTELQKTISLMLLKRQYHHTGPGVFKSHMDLCGIDKALILPVAPPEGDIEDQMRCMTQMFGADKRFALGISVPNTISINDIDRYVNEMIARYNVKAAKLHPNITGIDPATGIGKTRIESILWACEKNQIPLIVHGGGSRLLKDPKSSAYASIDNLKEINWAASGTPVIIAHAGFHSCSPRRIETDILPKIKKMLKSCDNILIDVSDLDINALILVFRNIEAEKILFGTDALYNAQWAMAVKTMYALSKADCEIEKAFCRIASINPSKHIFNEV